MKGSNPMKLIDLIAPSFLGSLQSLFASYLGTSLMITDIHGTPLIEPASGVRMCSLVRNTPKGAILCETSDRNGGYKTLLNKETYVYRCQAGFIDFSAAIVFRGEVIGLLVGGQSKSGTEKPDHLRRICADTGVPLQDLEQAYQEMPCVNEDRLREQLYFIKRVMELFCDLTGLYYERHLKDRKALAEANARGQIAENVKELFDRQLKTISHVLEGSADLPVKYDSLYKELEEMFRKTGSARGGIGEGGEYRNCCDKSYRICEVTYELQWVLTQIQTSYGEKIHIPEIAALDVPLYLCGDPAAISETMNRILQFMTKEWPDREILITVESRKDEYAALITTHFICPGCPVSGEEVCRIENALAGRWEQLPESSALGYLDLTMAAGVAEKLSADLSFQNGEGEGFSIALAVPQLPAKGGFY